MIGPTKADAPATSCHVAVKFVVLQCSGFQTATGFPKMSSWPPEMASIA